MYMQVRTMGIRAFTFSAPSDIDSPFTRDVGSSVVSWDADNAAGAKVQLGWDFGKIRSDLKINAYESGVGSINGAAASRDDFWFGSATLNGYWDIVNKKLGKRATITPYVGAGLGYMGGYIRATAASAGVSRRDNRVDSGLAGRAMLGAQLSVARHVGITLGYDFLVGDIDNSTFTNHAVELGLRLTF